jgi:MIP family channel proteins
MRDYLAEFIATFALVFIGAGAVVAGANTLGVALAHGFVLMSMIYAIGHISGGHINPVVTVAMWLSRKIGNLKALGYVIAQLAGGIGAAYLLKIIFDVENLGVPGLKSGLSIGHGVLIEGILTFFLVFVIFSVALDKRSADHVSGLAIGLVLTFDILMGGGLTGAAMNPARAFGPALISGIWTNHFVYWIGPLIGGILAGVIYYRVLIKKEDREEEPSLEEWKGAVKEKD